MLFNALKIKPKKLYKYLSSEGAKAFFKNPSLWFRLGNKLNDFYDMNPIGSDGAELGSIGILSLSETAISAPMWAHYGSNGNGVVLEFDTDSNFFKQYPLNKVNYHWHRLSIKELPQAITFKNSEWSYEREWRCITTPYDENGKFLSREQAIQIPFSPTALTSLIFGYDCSVTHEAMAFLRESSFSHVKPYVCRANSYNYGFKVLEPNDVTYLLEQQNAIRHYRNYKRDK